MSKIGSFEGIDNPESSKSSKKLDTSRIPAQNDRKKLDTSQAAFQSDRKKTSDIKAMGDREKFAYYRKNGMDSFADNRSAIMRRNKGNGENQRLTKLNSRNYDKLMRIRGLALGKAEETKESFAKWSPAARVGMDSLDQSHKKPAVLTRHALEGEKVRITGNKPGNGEAPKGIYVAKGFSKTPNERKEDFALPLGNKAEIVRSAELARPQDIIVGRIGSQQFENDEGNKVLRRGGGRQIVTDGGIEGRDINGDGIKEPAVRYTENLADTKK